VVAHAPLPQTELGDDYAIHKELLRWKRTVRAPLHDPLEHAYSSPLHNSHRKMNHGLRLFND
jgi:hypothetical protein